MRIVYLCADLGVPVLGGKGSSIHVRALTRALASSGHEVAVVASALVRPPWERPVALEVPILYVPPSDRVDAAQRAFRTFRETIGFGGALGGEVRRVLHNEELAVTLKRALERAPPELLVERASLFGTAGSRVAEALGVPHVLELNAPLALEQGAYRSGTLVELAAYAERWTLSRADAVVAVSTPLAAHAVRAGAAPGRVHVLANGVDPVRFRPGPRDPTLRARLRLGGGPLVGFVGGLRPWHGAEALPELLSRLVRRHPAVQLAVVGDGPRRDWLRAELDRRGLAGRAVLTGNVAHDDVPALLRELDVAVAPYPRPDHDFYFSPLKLFEYMASGTAVVASRVGQIAEIVRDGETGLLVEPGDADALAAACDRLLSDAGLRARLGEAASAEARRLHTWDAVAARFAELAAPLPLLKATA